MYNVMIAGAGKIGSLIACLLLDSGDYEVHLTDIQFTGSEARQLLRFFPQIKTVEMDVNKKGELAAYIKNNKIITIISCLPYFCNEQIALTAIQCDVHYFDLTEDVSSTATLKGVAKKSGRAMVPQCGLAPGFVSIAAHHYMQTFDTCFEAKLRVGSLPQQVNNSLQYALTWSTDGLLNEYDNLCHGIEAGKSVLAAPLEALESIRLDGGHYEAFNTSGGVGGLAERFHGKIDTLNYKTIRYPGHCEKMRFLMQGLKLNKQRELLKQILEKAIPKTQQDVVLIYIMVNGEKDGEYLSRSYFKKIYPKQICDMQWSAIQVSTAASVCAVVDIVMSKPECYQGFVSQEDFLLDDVLSNRFGAFYA